MATHSSILAWRIPGTEDPGGLPSMGSHRVGHDWSNLAAAAAAKIHYLEFLWRDLNNRSKSNNRNNLAKETKHLLVFLEKEEKISQD